MKKIEKLIGTDLNTKPTYSDDDKYVKTKIKTNEDNISTNLWNKKGSKRLPEGKIPRKFLLILVLDSILYAYEKYHSQILLEERKYAKENIKTKNYIDNESKSESESDSNSDSDTDIDTNKEE